VDAGSALDRQGDAAAI